MIIIKKNMKFLSHLLLFENYSIIYKLVGNF